MEGSVSPQIGQSDAKKQRSLLSRAGPALANLTLIALVLAIGYGGYSYLKSTRVQTPQRPAGEIARAVEAYPIRVGTYRPVLQLYGQITARRSVDLRVLVSGEVIAIADGLRNGGKVAAGEALVVVDQFEYDGALVRAKAEVAEAEARVAETRARIGLEQAALVQAREQRRITERELERLTTLERRGATSTALVDASKLRLSAAIATTEVRENQVKILEAQLQREIAALDRLRWNVEKADRDIKNTRLLAPFDGTISEPAADVGRLVNINDRIATLIDTSEYDVRFTLGDGQYGRLALVGNALTGREVSVSWKAGGNEFRTSGTIERVSPLVSASTGGFDVYARLSAGSGTRFIRPGTFVVVELSDIAYDDVARLPQSAIHPGNKVFEIGADNRLNEVAIDPVAFEGDFVLVKGALTDGGRVMATRLPDAGPDVLVDAKSIKGKP